jgi:hypothetical protein
MVTATLVCRYFNGRKVLAAVFWYSLNNLLDRFGFRGD